MTAKSVPYMTIRPSPGAVRSIITLFSHVLTTELKDMTEISTIYRECDGPCRKDQAIVVTRQLAIKTPGMIWFGCPMCGTQVQIRTDTPDELFSLPPEEQKLLAESNAGIDYRSKVSERVRKREQKKREELIEKTQHALDRKANPKLR